MNRKNIVWLYGDVRTPPFSKEARIEAGFLLRLLQNGETLGLPHSRPLREIGKNCHELRIPDAQHSWRIVYHIDSEAIVILDVFDKKTNRMPLGITEVCKNRLVRYRKNKNP
jgi:phage-related protein